MATKIGLNLSSLQNITPPDFNISTTADGILTQIPQKANELTGGWLGYGMLGSMFIALFWTLTDKTPNGDFGYDNLQAAALCFAITSIFGLVLLNLNFIGNLIVVSMSIIMTMVFNLLIMFTESQ